MSKALRYLRIAFSATCLIACVLLIVLWVRSYWQHYSVWHTSRNYVVTGVALTPGSIVIEDQQLEIGRDEIGWHFQSKSALENFIGGWKWERGLLLDSQEVSRLGYLTVSVPTWFLCGLSLVFAILPWLPFRFSLRTLLVAMTLIAVVLGLVVWAVR